jgi:hypothetical protein
LSFGTPPLSANDVSAKDTDMAIEPYAATMANNANDFDFM